ncbi:hypothetical protein ASPZODRAFT_148425 [Penicilliopsis zonata CBS 506.65]|uniref:ERCC4 domain-containing protein n=1 Tax=Penicilliopsis zonata CBS 506.65 TaxID=1073090 RepID=A0A1L9SVB4_9EURO|nr:hypothetical protein ASPZODRAFT_148425 [Penicilliopsis zonata CBS 506.65]OJJ51054.1 hypothetical protein ASPZODRAFT_148425 [Penicilliopsis zonata CBS 506.65]
MPEIIDLISSSPPPQVSYKSLPHRLSSPFVPLSSFLSDGCDEPDKPAKRQRVSQEPEESLQPVTNSPTEHVFLYSDEGSNGGGATKKSWNEESDPIVTSSAPQSRPAKRGASIVIDDDEDDLEKNTNGQETIEFSDPLHLPDLNELMESCERRQQPAVSSFSSRTASLLADLQSGATTSTRKARPLLEDDILDPQPRKTTTKRAPKPTTAEKEAKAREREAAKAQREREKLLEKERKQKIKEQKAKEKQLAADLSEVNKLKVDKKDSTPEMIVNLCSSFEETSVGNQAVEFMHRLGVEHSFFTSPVRGIIKWRRKVVAQFNETLKYWEPCPQHIRDENHILCYISAQDFVDMVLQSDSDGGGSLDVHVLQVKSAYPACQPIYLIEGLTAWMRKNQNSRNRAFQAQVRQQIENTSNSAGNTGSNSSTASRRRKNPETTPTVDDDSIEDALLRLQVTHACLIHHTNAAPESAEWIKNFTEHVSTIPYRRERMEGHDAAFCMDTGQVKTGDDRPDTFVKMLQEVNRVTPSIAYSILARYPSVRDLVDAMRVHGPNLLEDVKKSANKNGALADSRIGPAVSRRLYKVFMGGDPMSTDI